MAAGKDHSKENEIKAKLDIVDVIGRTVSLHRDSNGVYKGATSAHSKSGASLNVDQNLQVFNNHANSTGGDVLDWIGYENNLVTRGKDFPKVLKIAADLAGVELEGMTTEDIEKAQERLTVQDALTQAAEIYHGNLTTEIKEYITKKWGITEETIDRLKIGYAKPGDGSNVVGKISDELLPKTGLINQLFGGEISVTVAEHFQGRVVFPYWNSGKVVYFAARMDTASPIDTPVSEYETAKYKKLLTHNDKHPYVSDCVNNGYIWGEDTVRGKDFCVITEGIADAIILMQNDIPVLSPVTTKFAKHDIEKLVSIAQRLRTVYTCNDNEKSGAGEDGATRTGIALRKVGVDVRVMTLPLPEGLDKIDVAEYFLTKNKEDFNTVMEASEAIYTHLLSKIKVSEEKKDKIESAKKFIDEVVKFLPKTDAEQIINYDIKDHPSFKLGQTDTRILWSYYKDVQDKSCQIEEINKVGSEEKISVPFDIVADRIMERYPIFTMEDTREIYLYKDGLYQIEGAETTIKKEARNIYSEVFAEFCTNAGYELPDHLPVGGIRFCNEVLEHIRVFTAVDRQAIEQNNENIHLINMANCIFDFDSGKTFAHNPKFMMTKKLPVTFNPEASCPKTLEFLTGVMSEGDVQTILEFIGCCFLPEEKFQRGVMLQGEGENGKSVLLKLITKLIGDKYAAAVDLQSLCSDRFAVANLHNKLVNIYPDMSAKGLEDTNMFKAISTGDRITAQKKFGQPFEFYNFSKQMFSVNNVPYSKDDSYAYYRRWLYVEFPWKFVKNPSADRMEKKGDPDLFQKITTQEELSGFFNLAVLCGRYLYNNGSFSYGSTVEKVKERMTAKSDPIRAFMERYTESVDLNTTKAEMYNGYKRWVAVKSIQPVSQIKFGKRLKSMGITESRSRDLCSVQQNVWEDISLTDDFERDIPQISGSSKLLQFENTKKPVEEPYWKTLELTVEGKFKKCAEFVQHFKSVFSQCSRHN